MDGPEHLFRFIVVGDSNVGKTCLSRKFARSVFKGTHEPTIGVEFESKLVSVNNKNAIVQIWDTAGQESFKSITRSAIAGLLVFDVTNRNSFESIPRWLQETKTNANQKIVLCLVGNKADMEDARQVSNEEAEVFAKNNDLIYFEASAKKGTNVEEVFIQMSATIMDKIERGESDLVTDQAMKGDLSPYKRSKLREQSIKKSKKGCC